MKVRIKSLGLPKAAYGQQANYGLSLNGSGNAGSMQSNEFAMKSGLKPKRTISGVPREEANLEAEGGETVVGQISGDGIVDHMTIKGPRHSNGGVPMNLPDDSFIFSDTASMKIKDPKILQMFGKGKGSYTPAELAKPYDISKYKAILMDSDTDKLSRNTAEIMIKNIVMKLGALALAQEAKKGFPQGIPEIAKPYMEANGIAEEDLMPELRAQAEQMQAMQQQQAMQMQQAQGMQQPQMQQQGPPQGMPQMMPDGQPAAMPSQPMMDPQQMMAMQQEQQMMPPQPQQGMPMARYGIQKFAPGGMFLDKPCPDGMIYDPVLGCIPAGTTPTYTPEDLEKFNKDIDLVNPKKLREMQEYLNIPTDNEFYQKRYKDSEQHNEIDPFNNSKENLEYIEQNKKEINQFEMYKLIKQMQKEGVPLDQLKKYIENPEENEKIIDMYKSIDNQYEESVKDCPCREKIFVQGVQKEKCVPCESQPMAAYGMQLGGYDMPFVMGNGGLFKAHSGANVKGSHPEHHDPTYEEADEKSQEEYDAASGDGWREITDSQGRTYKVLYKDNKEVANTRREVTGFQGEVNESNKGSYGMSDVCSWLNDENSKWHNASYASLTGGKNPVIADTPANQEMYNQCAPKQEAAQKEVIDAIKVIPVENKTEGTCGCPDPEGGTNEDGTPKLINVQTKAALGIPEDQPCDDKYCEEITTTTENTPEVDELTPMPVIPGVSFNTGVADPIKAPLDIVDSSGRNYLDYRTAVQNDQGAIEKQIAAIKTMPGLTVGQRQGMIAQLQSQSKAPSIVTDVYNKNVATANELAKSDTALAANQQQLQAGIDGQYNQALAQSQNQRTQNINAARQYNVENTKDNMRMAMMSQSINNASENFDALGNFIGGTQLSAEMMCYECVKKAGVAACAQYCPGGSGNTQEEKPTEEKAKPNEGTQVARYGGVVNPYIMASSVYPWSK